MGGLLVVAAALLLFVATASAETRTGGSTAVEIFGAAPPEATAVDSTASYETDGSITFEVTTAAEPQVEREGAPSPIRMNALLFDPTGECSIKGFEVAIESEEASSLLPIVEITTGFAEPGSAGAEILARPHETPAPLPASKTVSGATTTLSFTSSAVANKGYDCALVETDDPSVTGGVGSAVVFPLAAPSPPPTAPAATSTPAPSTSTSTVAATPPAPGALAFARFKPLKLKAGKWKTVKVRVTNAGGTVSAQGMLRVSAPAGVLVEPETQKLPVLLPGGSWTVTVRLRPSAEAKKRSTIHLVGIASGLSVKGSFVVDVSA